MTVVEKIDLLINNLPPIAKSTHPESFVIHISKSEHTELKKEYNKLMAKPIKGKIKSYKGFTVVVCR